ncbi:MAG TPA: protein kinase family protein [Pirellulales bacterium]|nr:protein kinase family protein [Pirellulales bacterium]
MAASTLSASRINLKFLRNRDYQLVRELGSGACGRTVLLLDDTIDEHFVCKKFSPLAESQRKELFDGFVREIKLLHKLHHENVVRVFNHYLYPEQLTGYILMEYVDGLDVGDYIKANPEQTNGLFVQAVAGFAHLESRGVLHRDIRQTNILVRADGTLKVIDLGFGKRVQGAEDFDKSISLNWWCETPDEFAQSRYDFTSEVYFVGKLFAKLIGDNEVSHFSHLQTLGRMCQRDPQARIASFAEVEREIRSNKLVDFDFTEHERLVYRQFAEAVCSQITKIEKGAKYVADAGRIIRQLSEAHRCFMLEERVPDTALVIRCFLDGTYYYFKDKESVPVDCVRSFAALLSAATEEKRRIIIANLQTRLDRIHRYEPAIVPSDDDIPF